MNNELKNVALSNEELNLVTGGKSRAKKSYIAGGVITCLTPVLGPIALIVGTAVSGLAFWFEDQYDYDE